MRAGRRPWKLPVMIEAELEGLDWSIERGTKHWLLRIGNVLVCVLPHGNMNERRGPLLKQLRQDIRRHKKRIAA